MLTRFCYAIFFGAALSCLLSAQAQAQTTSGVAGASIKPNEKSAMWRVAYADNPTFPDSWASRVHYQQSFSDRLRARGVIYGDDKETGNFELVYLQGELHYQLRKPREDSRWIAGVRGSARITENDDGADRLGLQLIFQTPFRERWDARINILTAVDVGGSASSGVRLQTRGQVDYKLHSGHKVGVQMFNDLGKSVRFLADYETKNQLIGPYWSGKVGKEGNFLVGPLFGTSDNKGDVEFRLWLGKSLN